MEHDLRRTNKINKKWIFILIVIMFFAFGNPGGFDDLTSVHGQASILCGKLEVAVVSCELEEVYILYMQDLPPSDGGSTSSGEKYAMSIRTCEGRIYDIQPTPLLLSYSGQWIRMRDPVPGRFQNVCGESVSGIIGWSSIEVISSCSECIPLPSSVEIRVDRGCGGYYDPGDPITVSFKVTSSASTATVTLIDHTPDGRKDYKIKDQTFYTNILYTHEGIIECPGGVERVEIIATVAVGMQIIILRDECIFYVSDCRDPCEDIYCGAVCRGEDLWQQECVDGECVFSYLIDRNSEECGYNPCRDITCGTACRGHNLWSQECVDGVCVDYQLIESNSSQCGFDPCRDHCTNGKQDWGEYGVDCGSGCPIRDIDRDSVEACIVLCSNCRCIRVDANGCETDVDDDGVLDFEDDCPDKKGDDSNRGCPDNVNLIWIV